jgi:hypothetical protein
MRPDENRWDTDVGGIRDMQSCSALATLLFKFVLALVIGMIYLAVVLLN